MILYPKNPSLCQSDPLLHMKSNNRGKKHDNNFDSVITRIGQRQTLSTWLSRHRCFHIPSIYNKKKIRRVIICNYHIKKELFYRTMLLYLFFLMLRITLRRISLQAARSKPQVAYFGDRYKVGKAFKKIRTCFVLVKQ